MSKLKKYIQKWLEIPTVPDVEYFEKAMDRKSSEFDVKVRKAIHNAYAGIVCDKCGKNVYSEEGWMHTADKAYCWPKCWHEHVKELDE